MHLACHEPNGQHTLEMIKDKEMLAGWRGYTESRLAKQKTKHRWRGEAGRMKNLRCEGFMFDQRGPRGREVCVELRTRMVGGVVFEAGAVAAS